jgi:hypothetical protein
VAHPHRRARQRPDVVPRPEPPELLAGQGQLTDELGDPRIAGVGAERGAERRDQAADRLLPVGVQVPLVLGVASRLAASTSKSRLSTNAGSPSASSSCRMPAGTTSRRGRLGGAGRAADRLSRYCVAVASSPNTRASASITCADGLRSRPCSSRR